MKGENVMLSREFKQKCNLYKHNDTKLCEYQPRVRIREKRIASARLGTQSQVTGSLPFEYTIELEK